MLIMLQYADAMLNSFLIFVFLLLACIALGLACTGGDLKKGETIPLSVRRETGLQREKRPSPLTSMRVPRDPSSKRTVMTTRPIPGVAHAIRKAPRSSTISEKKVKALRGAFLSMYQASGSIPGLRRGQARENAAALTRPNVLVRVLKEGRDPAAIPIRANANPLPPVGRGKFHPPVAGCRNGDRSQSGPQPAPFTVDFKGKREGLCIVVREVYAPPPESSEEKGLRGPAGPYLVFHPYSSPSDSGPELVQLLGPDKSHVGLGLTGCGKDALGVPCIEEFTLRGDVASQNHPVFPTAEVADHHKIGRMRRNA